MREWARGLDRLPRARHTARRDLRLADPDGIGRQHPRRSPRSPPHPGQSDGPGPGARTALGARTAAPDGRGVSVCRTVVPRRERPHVCTRVRGLGAQRPRPAGDVGRSNGDTAGVHRPVPARREPVAVRPRALRPGRHLASGARPERTCRPGRRERARRRRRQPLRSRARHPRREHRDRRGRRARGRGPEPDATSIWVARAR
jgi:hypothetical protein